MNKENRLALVLVAVVVIAWLIYNSATEKPVPPKKQDTQSSTFTQKSQDSVAADSVTAAATTADTATVLDKFGPVFSPFTKGNPERIVIENELVRVVLSNKGASVLAYTLKKYKSWNGYKTQLIQNETGELYLSFLTKDNKRIDTRNLFFKLDNNGVYNYNIKGSDSLVLTATLNLDATGNKSITKRFVFYGNKYHFEQDIVVSNLESVIPSRGYNYVWSDGLKYQEHNSVDESGEAVSMASMNGNIEEVNASEDKPVESSPTGIVDYAAIKVKYFGAAIIPQPYKSFDGTVDLVGTRKHLRDEGMSESYTISFRVPYKGGIQKNSFKIYIGPLDYPILKDYDLGAMVNFGWRIIIRPIGEYFMLPIFTLIHKVVPNYGIAIIIFSIIMKFLLYPLSIQQMRSSQKMQLLGPEINKLREKYKDDNTTLQKETMKMYSEYGINPAGGCLPLLLQMPILYALWAVLRTSIDLRQATFFLWINDLSIADSIVEFPFSILGIKALSGLALLMGITMFIQQKMTITDPRQKAMVYMMPVMFTLMFSNFPSGLNLYYFMFNLMSIGQQLYINKFSSKKLTLTEMKRAPKKEGWIQKKMREAQDIAESQGRSIPGAKKLEQPGKNQGGRFQNKSNKKR